MHLDGARTPGVLTLSEPSLMEFFGGVVELQIQSVRRLEHAHFAMAQVVARDPRTDLELLVIDRLTAGERPGSDVLAVFQRDHEGSVENLGPEHLDTGAERFATAFAAVYESDDGGRFEATYRLLEGEEFHGVREVGSSGRPLSQAFYATGDDDDMPLALVEWEGDWLTVWFGKELRKDHVSVL